LLTLRVPACGVDSRHLGVLCSLALSLSSFPVARGGGVPPTTHPHEQLLMGLGSGWCVVRQLVLVLGSLLVVVGGKKHHYPPREQWLAGLEVGALSFLAAGGVGCFLSRG
jgi:hypothetical protein